MGDPLPQGLVYVNDAAPGIRRIRRGHGFAYRDSSGAWLRDRATLQRIRSLAIPPAYHGVWICTRPDGHLQATGRDARGRKQYRYHPEFRALREASKFDRLAAFGRALPRVRAVVQRDLAAAAGGNGPPTQQVVLATIVRLLDATFVRVGNDEYARSNQSFGLTTLRRRHAGVQGSVLRLNFRGKSGRQHEVRVDDARVTRIVRRCQQLPGQELFQFVDADGVARSVGSGEVNDYLEQVCGERFTAKDFRTWHGSVQALELLSAAAADDAARGVHRTIPLKPVITEVAARLGNTPAVCRKSYIHPDVVALAARWPEQAPPPPPRRRGLSAAECRLLQLLEPRGARRRASR
ncbi:MAG TPA: DNA topoisomerase IB [Burkholderiaceae bacterium]|nr:DNA topoisomerase IB [Burkholderiaceae bacterium]